MKKVLLALAVVTSVGLFSFNDPAPTFKLTLNQQQAEALLYVVNNSAAPHNVVTEVQNILNQQFGEQVAALQKAAADSAAKKNAVPEKPAKKN